MTIAEIFASRVRKRLIDLDWSQEQLAVRLGVARGTVAGYLQGKTPPGSEVLLRWADALGCSVEHLLGRDVDVYDPTAERQANRLKAYEMLVSASDDAVEIVLSVLKKDAALHAKAPAAADKKRKPAAG
jgi:transcriptional regulator with XRE-family HTH domain